MARDWQSLNQYTLFCRGRLANPYPLYHQLRSEDPVHWSDRANSWILTRYPIFNKGTGDLGDFTPILA